MKIQVEQILPGEIEKRSFEIIQEELSARGIHLDSDKAPVIMRAIHATADFDYASNLAFSPGAARKAEAALAQGAHIVTDTRMAWSGIGKGKLEALGGQAFCYMADQDVRSLAEKKGITRAAASMEKAADLYGKGGRHSQTPCIFAIGNAPTALIRLYELIQEGKIAPALVIGVPVGFVNVIQGKELILSLEQTPYIVAKGRKGGSSLAAAICNALIYQLS